MGSWVHGYIVSWAHLFMGVWIQMQFPLFLIGLCFLYTTHAHEANDNAKHTIHVPTHCWFGFVRSVRRLFADMQMCSCPLLHRFSFQSSLFMFFSVPSSIFLPGLIDIPARTFMDFSSGPLCSCCSPSPSSIPLPVLFVIVPFRPLYRFPFRA